MIKSLVIFYLFLGQKSKELDKLIVVDEESALCSTSFRNMESENVNLLSIAISKFRSIFFFFFYPRDWGVNMSRNR